VSVAFLNFIVMLTNYMRPFIGIKIFSFMSLLGPVFLSTAARYTIARKNLIYAIGYYHENALFILQSQIYLYKASMGKKLKRLCVK